MASESLKRKRIGVLMGGLSGEREVSLQTGASVAKALNDRGYEAVTPIDVDTEVCSRLRAEAIEVAFLALHGRYGEDGCLQGLLEVLRIPYTGSGVLASAMAMDKVITKRLLSAAGLPTAAWAFPASVGALELPVVLKPRAEGSSLGLHVVDDAAELERLLATEPALLAERYIPGRELSVAVLGSGEQARCLGIIEIRAKDGLYDYRAKYERDDTVYVVSPELPEHVSQRMQDVALASHRLLECSGVTRIDFRYDDGDGSAGCGAARPGAAGDPGAPCVTGPALNGDGAREPLLLEINTLPGLTSHSLVPKIAAAAGISYGALVELIVEDAALKA